jgi:hypothetical protein
MKTRSAEAVPESQLLGLADKHFATRTSALRCKALFVATSSAWLVRGDADPPDGRRFRLEVLCSPGIHRFANDRVCRPTTSPPVRRSKKAPYWGALAWFFYTI